MARQISNIKEITRGTISNRVIDSIVIVYLRIYIPGRQDFVLWYLRQFGVKRLRRENDQVAGIVVGNTREQTFFSDFGTLEKTLESPQIPQHTRFFRRPSGGL